MLFSQTFGQPLENRPVIYRKPSKGWKKKTVPAAALCAPGHFSSLKLSPLTASQASGSPSLNCSNLQHHEKTSPSYLLFHA